MFQQLVRVSIVVRGGALRAETIGAEYGIGAFVLQAGNLMRTDQFLAGVVIPAPFALAVGRLSSPLGARLLHWR